MSWRRSQATDGALTYVDLAYVQANDLQYALLQNAAGKYPEPGVPSVTAAAKVGTTNPDGSISLVNPPASAADAYPDATFTYVIVPQDSPKASTLKAFLQYAIGPTGQAIRSRPRVSEAPVLDRHERPGADRQDRLLSDGAERRHHPPTVPALPPLQAP